MMLEKCLYYCRMPPIPTSEFIRHRQRGMEFLANAIEAAQRLYLLNQSETIRRAPRYLIFRSFLESDTLLLGYFLTFARLKVL